MHLTHMFSTINSVPTFPPIKELQSSQFIFWWKEVNFSPPGREAAPKYDDTSVPLYQLPTLPYSRRGGPARANSGHPPPPPAAAGDCPSGGRDWPASSTALLTEFLFKAEIPCGDIQEKQSLDQLEAFIGLRRRNIPHGYDKMFHLCKWISKCDLARHDWAQSQSAKKSSTLTQLEAQGPVWYFSFSMPI